MIRQHKRNSSSLVSKGLLYKHLQADELLNSEDVRMADGHLHVAGERRHDVDVEAGHLVQAVEHHRVLPGEDRDGNWAVADSKDGFEYQKKRSERIRPESKVGFEPGRPKAGGWREEESLRDD